MIIHLPVVSDGTGEGHLTRRVQAGDLGVMGSIAAPVCVARGDRESLTAGLKRTAVPQRRNTTGRGSVTLTRKPTLSTARARMAGWGKKKFLLLLRKERIVKEHTQ